MLQCSFMRGVHGDCRGSCFFFFPRADFSHVLYLERIWILSSSTTLRVSWQTYCPVHFLVHLWAKSTQQQPTTQIQVFARARKTHLPVEQRRLRRLHHRNFGPGWEKQHHLESLHVSSSTKPLGFVSESSVPLLLSPQTWLRPSKLKKKNRAKHWWSPFCPMGGLSQGNAARVLVPLAQGRDWDVGRWR